MRCRFVARDFKRAQYWADLFAAASPVSTSRIIPMKAVKCKLKTFTFDSSNAFFHVPVTEPSCADPPAEWTVAWIEKGGDLDTIWELRRELYGRRKAPQAWTEWKAQQLLDRGFLRCAEAPWIYQHSERDIAVDVHMDDGHGCASVEDAEWFRDSLQETFVLKEFIIQYPGARYTHLKRQ